MRSVLVDTGVWLAIFDPRDRVRDRESVDALALRLEKMSVVVPWPITYETLRTRFVRNRLALEGFERQLKSPLTEFLGDDPYREKALAHALESSLRRRRPLSLVDCMIRILLDQPTPRIRYLATYNVADFIDICTKRNIELLVQ